MLSLLIPNLFLKVDSFQKPPEKIKSLKFLFSLFLTVLFTVIIQYNAISGTKAKGNCRGESI